MGKKKKKKNTRERRKGRTVRGREEGRLGRERQNEKEESREEGREEIENSPVGPLGVDEYLTTSPKETKWKRKKSFPVVFDNFHAANSPTMMISRYQDTNAELKLYVHVHGDTIDNNEKN